MTLLANIVTFIVIVVVLGPLVWLEGRWTARKAEDGQDRAWQRARERTRRIVGRPINDDGAIHFDQGGPKSRAMSARRAPNGPHP